MQKVGESWLHLETKKVEPLLNRNNSTIQKFPIGDLITKAHRSDRQGLGAISLLRHVTVLCLGQSNAGPVCCFITYTGQIWVGAMRQSLIQK